jgi:Methyltransferase domain
MNKCPICNSMQSKCFTSKLLNKYDVSYFHCEGCGLLQTESPYWLDEAYRDVIVDVDTGLLSRNIAISKKLASFLSVYFSAHESYVDIAGGYGTLTRLMRDIGFDFYWQDPYCNNMLAKGFESDAKSVTASVVTAFEVLEHIQNPVEFIQNTLSQSQASTLIFSTELFEGSPPQPDDWWYYLPQTGQHISFYQSQTLEKIAEILGMNFYSANRLHMLSRNMYNPLLYKILTGKLSRFAYHFSRFKLKSKTVSDYELLSERSR